VPTGGSGCSQRETLRANSDVESPRFAPECTCPVAGDAWCAVEQVEEFCAHCSPVADTYLDYESRRKRDTRGNLW
jgi:hypothetical protein